MVEVERAREGLQRPANYLVNMAKQYVFTNNEAHLERIETALPQHKVIYIRGRDGHTISGIPIGGDDYISTVFLQDNLDKTRSVIDSIKKLDNTQERLILLLQCIPGRIQPATVPMHLSRDFARQHN